MTLFLTILEEANQTLAQYSPYFQNFTIEPRVINIQPQISNYSFVVTQMQAKVPPSLTLQFKLTSLYPIVHNLTTPQMYLCFDQDPRFNVLYPPMRVKVTPYLSSCNINDVGKNVTNIFITNTSSGSSASSVQPSIISVHTISISSTGANFKVNLDSLSTVYYLCQQTGYANVSDISEIQFANLTNAVAGSTTSAAQSITSGSTSQINYVATFSIANLTSMTNYSLYLFSSSNLG